MKIKFDTKTIEVSKTFANKASNYGSEEYMTLRAVTNELPNFCVVVKASATACRTYMKGLTYKYMESYIAMVDSDGTMLADFCKVRQSCGYAVTKRWFLNQFPDPNNFAA